MDNKTTMGMNRTGMQMAPLNGASMVDYAADKAMDAPPEYGDFETMHRAYIEEADSVGSVPVPGTVKGAIKTGASKMMGTRPEVLMDKLGERLAFERTGARLYGAMITKVESLQGGQVLDDSVDNAETDAYESLDGEGADTGDTDDLAAAAPARVDLATLEKIRDEELEHFHLVKDAIEELGGDPTAMTPCADVAGVMAMGVMQTVTDPRTTVAQCLNALLTAELNDNASWELLMDLTERLGHDDMAVRFSVAYTTEMEHLAIIKAWLRAEVMAEAL